MIKRIVSFILIVFSLSNLCICQVMSANAGPILFRGVVVDASSRVRLPGSQILVNRIMSAISRDDGTFSLYAVKRDTITFTMLGYKPAFLIVSDTLSGNEFLTGVYLETDTLIIGEVIILPRITSLKTEMMNPVVHPDAKMENAKSNLSVASYQGRTGQGKLGDPAINYELIRKQHKINAYEKGGIPSDRIAGISPFMLIPAIYLLINGLPEKPPPPKPQISSKDLEDLNKRYMESLMKK